MIRRIWILTAFLLAISIIEGDGTSAQVRQDPSSRGDMLTLTQPLVLAGPDVGFRVIRMNGQIPVGQLVVRINGVWMTAETSK